MPVVLFIAKFIGTILACIVIDGVVKKTISWVMYRKTKTA